MKYFKPAERSCSLILLACAGGKPGSHRIQGIGPGFVPETLNVALLDRIVPVHSDDAIDMARRLTNEEGLLVGISSGAAFAAALRVNFFPFAYGFISYVYHSLFPALSLSVFPLEVNQYQVTRLEICFGASSTEPMTFCLHVLFSFSCTLLSICVSVCLSAHTEE